GPDLPINIEGRVQSAPDRNEGYSQWRVITPNYFRAMRIPLLKGRYFTEGDTERSAAVVIINENLARTFWPDQDAVGHYLTIGRNMGPDLADVPRQIVGVVGNVRDEGWDKRIPCTVFVPHAQVPTPIMRL